MTGAGPAGRVPATTDPAEDPVSGAVDDPGALTRAGRTMALGTAFSRATGFLRLVVIAAAIGAGPLGDAYNIANVLPNIVYELLLGGVLTSVVVPLLVQAAHRDRDGGEAYAGRLLTVVGLALGVTSVLAVLAAPLLIGLYGRLDGEQRQLAVALARFFLPQIFFYGVGAMIGAVLNTRGRFGAPMWAPVLNNLVVITTGVVFLALPDPRTHELALTTAQTLTLAMGTTAGIVVQTVALWPSLRATGFRWRPRLDLRGSGLGDAGRLAGWVLLYVAVNQLGYVVVVNLSTAAARSAGTMGAAGYSPYFYAFTLFSLPHAVVAVSVITALLPRMSRHAAAERLDAVRADLSSGLRLAGVVLVPTAVAYLALGPLIATLVFNHGRIGITDARQIGMVLAGFAVGLLPFSAFQLHLRAFYALSDTRTPALVNVAVNAVMVAVDLLLYAVLPAGWRVAGLAVGYAASYIVGFGLTNALLRQRLPGGRPERILQVYRRLLLAAAAGLVPAYLASRLVTMLAGTGAAGAGLALAVALPVGGALYLLAARRLGVGEVQTLTAALSLRRG